jgi:hypothetical protein
MVHHLQESPLEFGDPAYRLKALNLDVRAAIVEPLSVQFADHEDLRIVFVMRIQGLSRFGF